MYQSERAGDEAKKRKSHAKSGRVGMVRLAVVPCKDWATAEDFIRYMHQSKTELNYLDSARNFGGLDL